MPTSAGMNTEAAWGPLRVSAVATAARGMPFANPVDIPATLTDTFTYQAPGAFGIEDAVLNVVRNDIQQTFFVAHEAGTQYPYVRFIRGAAGGYCNLLQEVALGDVPDRQEVGALRSNDYTLFAGDARMHVSGGMLFDHTIAHAAGVTAPVTSTPIQVGAVSATQSVIVYFGNLHSPAPTWSGAAMQLESDPLATFLVATLRGSAVTGLGSTASYSLQTIAGPITDPWWRLNITTVPSGIGWPVCCMWIVDN